MGVPLVDHPERVGEVRALRIDETKYQSAKPTHRPSTPRISSICIGASWSTWWRGSRERPACWCARQDPDWLAAIEVTATDLTEHYRAGMSPHLEHTIRAVRVANRCVDQVRRRVQNELTGHRAGRAIPFSASGRLLVSGAERLDEKGDERLMLGPRLGDPRVGNLGAWLAN
jgi:transposase